MRPAMSEPMLKRLALPGELWARALPGTEMDHPTPPAAAPSGPPRPASPALPSPLLPDATPLLPDLATPLQFQHHDAAPAAAAEPAVGADATPVPNRVAVPWAVRAARPAALVADAAAADTTAAAPAAVGLSWALPDVAAAATPPPHAADGAPLPLFAPVVRAGGACHYNQTSCSCARRAVVAASPTPAPMCVRYAGPGASAGALPRCTAGPCDAAVDRYVCDCMGPATCGVRRAVVDRWRRVGEGGGGTPPPGERFRCELQERLVTVTTCVENCG